MSNISSKTFGENKDVPASNEEQQVIEWLKALGEEFAGLNNLIVDDLVLKTNTGLAIEEQHINQILSNKAGLNMSVTHAVDQVNITTFAVQYKLQKISNNSNFPELKAYIDSKPWFIDAKWNPKNDGWTRTATRLFQKEYNIMMGYGSLDPRRLDQDGKPGSGTREKMLTIWDAPAGAVWEAIANGNSNLVEGTIENDVTRGITEEVAEWVIDRPVMDSLRWNKLAVFLKNLKMGKRLRILSTNANTGVEKTFQRKVEIESPFSVWDDIFTVISISNDGKQVLDEYGKKHPFLSVSEWVLSVRMNYASIDEVDWKDAHSMSTWNHDFTRAVISDKNFQLNFAERDVKASAFALNRALNGGSFFWRLTTNHELVGIVFDQIWTKLPDLLSMYPNVFDELSSNMNQWVDERRTLAWVWNVLLKQSNSSVVSYFLQHPKQNSIMRNNKEFLEIANISFDEELGWNEKSPILDWTHWSIDKYDITTIQKFDPEFYNLMNVWLADPLDKVKYNEIQRFMILQYALNRPILWPDINLISSYLKNADIGEIASFDKEYSREWKSFLQDLDDSIIFGKERKMAKIRKALSSNNKQFVIDYFVANPTISSGLKNRSAFLHEIWIDSSKNWWVAAPPNSSSPGTEYVSN